MLETIEEEGTVNTQDENALERCLADAGWEKASIAAFVTADDDDRKRLALKHRRKLLDGMHATQRQIDCTDYLLHELECESAATC